MLERQEKLEFALVVTKHTGQVFGVGTIVLEERKETHGKLNVTKF